MIPKFSRLLLLGTMLSPVCAPVLAADVTGAVTYMAPPGTDPATPAPATSRISGYLEGFVGYANNDAYDAGTLFGGAGRFNIWTSANTALQLDAWGNSYSISSGPTDSAFGVAGHFAWRDPNSYALGGLVSYGHNSFSSNSWATVGIDAQKYFGNLTAYGQAGFTFGASGYSSSTSARGFYVMGTLRYFVTPNFAVSGNFGGDWFTNTYSNHSNGTRWGLKLEAKPQSMPIAAYISYEGSSQASINENSIVGGVQLLFGQGSLQAMERNGAGFEDQNPVYGSHRPHFWTPY